MKPLFPSLAFVSVLGLSLSLGGCVNFSDDSQDYEPLSFMANGDHFIAQGVIDDSTPDMVRAALAEHPQISTVIMQYVPGSIDDEANLEAARLLRIRGMKTIVPSDGLVASGGTDMFLAGIEREIGSGACLGVHSWGGGDGSVGFQASVIPRNDPQHQIYLDYYDDMKIDQDFYWYTLDAADADNIHYMSNAEILKYGAATKSISGNEEASPQKCEQIEQRYGFS